MFTKQNSNQLASNPKSELAGNRLAKPSRLAKSAFAMVVGLLPVLASAQGIDVASLPLRTDRPNVMAELRAGQDIVVREDAEGSVWPRVYVYKKLPGSPRDYAAIFANYERHRYVFANLARSQITSSSVWTDASGVAHHARNVSYQMTFPTVLGMSLPPENYEVRDVASTYETAAGKAYAVTWAFIRATSMRNLEGSVRFEPFDGGTLMEYYNFITPPRPAIARLLAGRNADSVQAAANAIQTEYVRINSQEPGLLVTQRTELDALITAPSH